MVRDDGMCSEELLRMGRMLREARLARHMTQDVLAEKTGISKRHITHIEKGKANPSYTVLKLISSALNFSMNSLFDDAIDEEKVFENQLLMAYRSCPSERKMLILNVIRTLTDGLKEKNEKLTQTIME